MKPSQVLKQLDEHRETYKKQGFSFTKEQQAEYNRLLKLRRERVKYFYDNDRVWKGPSSKQTKEATK
tara:strand:+ start:196 stop:396 length:201 start_codon:yes stop_codon:yes gene_type:complete